MKEYTLTLNSVQAKEIDNTLELLMRWKLKQPGYMTDYLLDFSDNNYNEKHNKIQSLLKKAMDIAMPNEFVRKDKEWYTLYNIHQAIRYAIHEAEHPETKGVDAYPPLNLGPGEPPPACTWAEKQDTLPENLSHQASKEA